MERHAGIKPPLSSKSQAARRWPAGGSGQGDPAKPGGVGELSGTAVTPAIANAVFRLTGKRLTETPFDLSAVA
ncbi:hypothetical protein BFF94_012825 [Burkholderia catarinensis]|nr:hypothetical protein BFF94_012825 [Burkholderia catarinensis]